MIPDNTGTAYPESHPRIEDDRHLARRHLAGAEPAHRALAGTLPDGGGILQVTWS